jgi:hypothetical protein
MLNVEALGSTYTFGIYLHAWCRNSQRLVTSWPVIPYAVAVLPNLLQVHSCPRRVQRRSCETRIGNFLFWRSASLSADVMFTAPYPY